MTYRINEIFYTLQGEGHWTGSPAVFIRFSGCNLWSGLEKDRAAAICQFCDTNFTDYTEYTLRELITEIRAASAECGFVVLTGGEPALHVDGDLIDELSNWGYYIAVETNGTKPLPPGVDWVCVSPKTPRIRVESADELKLVFPQRRVTPDMFDVSHFTHAWISPMDGPELDKNTVAAIEFVKANPAWRLNTQAHKRIGIR